MSEKIIATLLAVVVGLGSIATNALAFGFVNSSLMQGSNLFGKQSRNGGSPESDNKNDSQVSERYFGDGFVPDLVGLSVSDAFHLRTQSGYDFVFFEEGGSESPAELPLSSQNSKDIFVCKQALPGGAQISSTEAPSSIEVLVSPHCKGQINPFLVGKAKASPSVWEPIRPTDETGNVVQGWIYGFAGEDENVKIVNVLTYSGIRTFELAMIDLVGTSGCGIEEDDWDTYLKNALNSKHSTLPIGNPVSAVLDWVESNENEAFFHLLNPSTGEYELTPPDGSINEQLVREGFWIPEGQHITLGPEYVAEKKQKWVSTDGYLELTPLGKTYRKLLLASANTMRKSPKETLATCIAYETKSFVSIYGAMDVRWKYGIPGGRAPAGCTWVNPYVRGGSVVRGYWRC